MWYPGKQEQFSVTTYGSARHWLWQSPFNCEQSNTYIHTNQVNLLPLVLLTVHIVINLRALQVYDNDDDDDDDDDILTIYNTVVDSRWNLARLIICEK